MSMTEEDKGHSYELKLKCLNCGHKFVKLILQGVSAESAFNQDGVYLFNEEVLEYVHPETWKHVGHAEYVKCSNCHTKKSVVKDID